MQCIHFFLDVQHVHVLLYACFNLYGKFSDESLSYRKSGNFRCKNIFVVDDDYEN